MKRISPHQRSFHSRTRRILQAAGLALLALTACSTNMPATGPTTTPAVAVGTGSPSSASAPTATPASGCRLNPASASVPTADPYETVPGADQMVVSLSGIPSGTVTPGSAPTEVDVTVCNSSPVDYPKVGVVLVLSRCSCAPDNPIGMPSGTVERFDPATGSWIQLKHPVAGSSMDYIGGFTNVQSLAKGQAVTLRYRIALDASMTDGEGRVQAGAVLPATVPADGPTVLGEAGLHFTASTSPTASPTGPTPPPSPTSSCATVAPVTLPIEPPPNSGCQGVVVGHSDLEHPTLGTVRVFLFLDSARFTNCILPVTRSGRVLPAIPIDGREKLGFANPATDATGNMFVVYNPGRYDGVLVLIPNADGFEDIGWEDKRFGTHYDGKHAYYSAELIGPDNNGVYTIRQSDNDCTPSCADGATTSKDLHWDGHDYVP